MTNNTNRVTLEQALAMTDAQAGIGRTRRRHAGAVLSGVPASRYGLQTPPAWRLLLAAMGP
jgi:hypothetical protein